MEQFTILILLLPFVLSPVEAQPYSSQDNYTSSQDVVTNFQPSLAVVVAILGIMFTLTFLLLLYAKFCHRPASVHNNHNLDGAIGQGSRFSGIDKTVIDSLPFFRFSSLRGSREGLECAVCLSRFEETEILRLLPKCKHAFHVDCVDRWLEKHSSCPLCRLRVSPQDLSSSALSSSFRLMWSLRQDSGLDLFVQREEEQRGSSRFGGSFSRAGKARKEEELPIQGCSDDDLDQKILHKFNHKIIVSDVVLKNRWSNVSPSDLMFLSSEMIDAVSSARFSSIESNNEDGEIAKIKEEMERKRVFEGKVSKVDPDASRILNSNDKRSMSEIIVHPRFTDLSLKNSIRGPSFPENAGREERVKRVWLPIARRTVQWFASRERRSAQHPQSTRELLNL